MCLQVSVVPSMPGQAGPRRLSDESGLIFEKVKRSDRGELSISREPGCACSMLDDDAEFADETWAFDPAVLEPLVRGLSILARESTGFTFAAVWAGDRIKGKSEVRLAAFLELIRKNQIRNAWTYSVKS